MAVLASTFYLRETASIYGQFRYSEEMRPIYPDKQERLFVLPFTNKFALPIRIHTTVASCGCTKDVTFDRIVFQPDETGEMNVSFKTLNTSSDTEIKIEVFAQPALERDEPGKEKFLAAEYELTIPVRAPVSSKYKSAAFESGFPEDYAVIQSTIRG
jgi:hypothetical protein